MSKIPIGPMIITIVIAIAGTGAAQERAIVKTGLTPQDWKYAMPEGVTVKEITYFSDGVGCYGKLFYPKGFSIDGKTPGVVLGQGWAGTHFSVEKYGARFAERGLVALVIDYRGWGSSDGFISQSKPTVARGETGPDRDDKRFTNETAEIMIKRTRLIPLKQVEDYRNAISYLQGEPGVNRDSIGIWGSSYAGGHVLSVAAQDARVKAVVSQIPGINGRNSANGPVTMRPALLEDAIKRARTGQGAEFETGFSVRRMIDVETNQLTAEYRPFLSIPAIGNRPVLMVAAENDELCRLPDIKAAYEALPGPRKLVVVPQITHFQMYIDEAFETGSNAAAAWFQEHLKN
jgi:dienelactone hydrolase